MALFSAMPACQTTSWLGEEHRPGDDAVCAIEPVDGMAALAGDGTKGSPCRSRTSFCVRDPGHFISMRI